MKKTSLLIAASLLALLPRQKGQATILTFDIQGISNYDPISGYGNNVNALVDDNYSYYGLGNGFTP